MEPSPSSSDAAEEVPAADTETASTARYLRRIGIDPQTVDEPDWPTLARLQRAHVRTVPFETLSITGDPRGIVDPLGVDLSVSTLYEKLVRRERGGYCFELNGLFYRLLTDLGYDARRVAARVLSDGEPGVPANHHAIVVALDRAYLVDVGLGTPKVVQPVPLDGDVAAGRTDWRVVPADRPDEDYRVLAREPGGDWRARYVFTDRPVDLDYFRAANDHLQTAPESPFTGEPHLSVATVDGYARCDGRQLTRVAGDDRSEQILSAAEWYAALRSTFGITLAPSN